MSFRSVLAIIAGKSIILLSRMMGNQGTDYAGRIALKIDPLLLRRLSAQIQQYTIIITGTNGKTTTTNMIAAILQQAGLSYVHNRAGANMISGITTAFIRSSTLSGKCTLDCALLETDEANVPLLMRELSPDYILITNFFRDQLDRYGELDTTIRLIRDGIAEVQPQILINADDPLQAHFRYSFPQRCQYYGFAPTAYDTDHSSDSREGRFCVNCGAELHYHSFHYAHLGLYRCPNCDNTNPPLDYCGEKLQLRETIDFSLNGMELSSPYQGFHNAYNVLAAAALGQSLGIADKQIQVAIEAYQPRAGRMEKFRIQGQEVTLVLVKNPTGLDQSLSALQQDEQTKTLFFALNDNAADGRDVSWIWDAEFESVAQPAAGIEYFVASGIRSGDIALRAKYAGLDQERILIESDLATGIAIAIRQPSATSYIFSTYTALFACRRILQRYTKKFPNSQTMPERQQGGENA